MYEVIVRLIDMPLSIRGITVKDENDDFNMYINAKLSNAKQQQTYWHEMDHIKLGHFYTNIPVEIKEKQIG